MRYRTLSAIAALMNEITFFYNAFLFFSFADTKMMMRIDYWPWACGGAAILLWNRWFLRKSRSLVSIIAVNALVTSLWLLLGLRYFFHIQGLTAYGFAIVFLISTTVRAVYLSTHEVPDQRMVMYTEICIISIGFFFFIQMKPFIVPMNYNIPSLAIFLLNILALINMRLFSEDAKGIDISKLRGGLFLIAIFGIIIGGIAGILTFVSANFRTFVVLIITTVKEIIIRFFIFLDWLFNILLRWLKPKDYSDKGITDFKFKLPKIDKREPLNIDIIGLIPWISILFVLAVLIYLFFKYRKLVIRRYTISGTISQKRIKRDFKLWSKFKSYMKVLYKKIYLLYMLIHMRHTPQGMFLTIERWGRCKGFPRKVWETPGTYLNRLMDSKAWNKDLKETTISEIVQCLIKELEWKFYSKSKDFDHSSLISKDELKALIPYFHVGLFKK